jgi:hypothetical protein
MNPERKAEQQTEQDTIGSTVCQAETAGKLILRHLLAGSICAGISFVVMSVFIIGISVLGGGGGILIHHFPVDNIVNTAPAAGERILIMAFWITIGVSMAGTLMGFGRKNPERVLGCFPSLVLAVLAGSLFGAVLYGLFLFLRWPVYDGHPSSVWLPLGIGVLFGVIGWGNVIGWSSTKTDDMSTKQ